MRRHRVAVIAGDGIGVEVVPPALRVLERLAQRGGFTIEFTEFPWSCAYYLAHGVMMPADGFETLKTFDAIFLGAIGDPRVVPDHISLHGLLLPIRQRFDLYVNLRPSRTFAGIPTPLKGDPQFDIAVVRENTEGEYAGMGGRLRAGTADEVALQTTIFTRKGVERIARYAFELARKRNKRLTSATKSNAQQFVFVMWDEVIAAVAAEYPDIELRRFHVDALTAALVRNPSQFDVIVASNLFGDILTDLTGALQGSLGIPASANLNPERQFPSLFEPVHGSAPDIAGRGIANPIATLWAASMMLDFLGEVDSAAKLLAALEANLAEEKIRTADIGGSATTAQVIADIYERL